MSHLMKDGVFFIIYPLQITCLNLIRHSSTMAVLVTPLIWELIILRAPLSLSHCRARLVSFISGITLLVIKHIQKNSISMSFGIQIKSHTYLNLSKSMTWKPKSSNKSKIVKIWNHINQLMKINFPTYLQSAAYFSHHKSLQS